MMVMMARVASEDENHVTFADLFGWFAIFWYVPKTQETKSALSRSPLAYCPVGFVDLAHEVRAKSEGPTGSLLDLWIFELLGEDAKNT